MKPVHALIYNSPAPFNVSFRRNQVLRNSLYFWGYTDQNLCPCFILRVTHATPISSWFAYANTI